ncbi:MAG: hypothetical protein D3904_00275 [Candidatus Electrothrix sp. EH2]|nr:hypothetical protein [Candidatus Electrothrix sp. EH2]
MYRKIIRDFFRIAQHNLTLCASGNLSCRKDAHHMLISVSGFWFSEITEDQIAICRF